MTQEKMKEKVEMLLKDEAFVSKLKVCETAESVCALYATEGIEITPEELEATVDQINDSGKEFTAEELDNVAGGVLVSGTVFLAGCIWYSCTVVGAAYQLGKRSRRYRKY